MYAIGQWVADLVVMAIVMAIVMADS